MTRRKGKAKITSSELEILQTLWQNGPSTVREIHELLGRDGEVAYTTTLKLMQIMLEKGLIDREEEGRAHRYRAVASTEEKRRDAAKSFLSKLFAGSPSALLLNAIDHNAVADEEIDELQKIIDGLRAKQSEGSTK